MSRFPRTGASQAALKESARLAGRHASTTVASIAVAAVGLSLSAYAQADTLSCRLDFTMKGWSAIYKTATGSGTVTCDNGATMKVLLESKGFGLTAGKSTIDVGQGAISGLKDINDVLGHYASADASAAAIRAGAVTVLTKGEVSLGLSGTGRGWELGVSFSDFTIKR